MVRAWSLVLVTLVVGCGGIACYLSDAGKDELLAHYQAALAAA